MEERIIIDAAEHVAVIQVGDWAHKYALGDVKGVSKTVNRWWDLVEGADLSGDGFAEACRAFFYDKSAEHETEARAYQPGPGSVTMGLSTRRTVADYGFVCLMEMAVDTSAARRRKPRV